MTTIDPALLQSADAVTQNESPSAALIIAASSTPSEVSESSSDDAGSSPEMEMDAQPEPVLLGRRLLEDQIQRTERLQTRDRRVGADQLH